MLLQIQKGKKKADEVKERLYMTNVYDKNNFLLKNHYVIVLCCLFIQMYAVRNVDTDPDLM